MSAFWIRRNGVNIDTNGSQKMTNTYQNRYSKYACLVLPLSMAACFTLFGMLYVRNFNVIILTLSEEDTVYQEFTSSSQCNHPSLPNDVLSLIRACKFTKFVLIDPQYLVHLNNTASGACVKSQSTPLIRLAVIEETNRTGKDSVLHGIASRSISLEWTSMISKRRPRSVILKKSGTVVLVSLLEPRPNYWYFHGTTLGEEIQEPPRAFLGLNLSTHEIEDNPSTKLLIPIPTDFYIWQWPRSKYIECNRTASEYVRKKYPSMYKEKPVLDEKFIDMLVYCRDLLLKYRLTVMLAGGTALGWYRECGIIPHTTDTDVAFLAKEWKPEVEEVLKNDSVLKLSWILGKPDDGLELTVHVLNSKIDINALYEEGNRSYVGAVGDTGFQNKKTKIRWWYPKFQGACAVDLKGHLFYVRCDILDELTALYGPKWYEHHHSYHFSWHSSHKNVEWISTYNASEWSSVYRVFE